MDGVVSAPSDEALILRTSGEIRELCKSFPSPGISA